MNSPSAKPPRWLQFSLRTLFVLMLVVAAFFGGRESMRPAIERVKDSSRRAQADALRERQRSQEWQKKAWVSDAMMQRFIQQELISAREARELKETVGKQADNDHSNSGTVGTQ